jgi:hypothetical protein
MSAHDQPLPPIVVECIALRELADWAETLLCNSSPLDHCEQSEWDTIIGKWLDQKHALRIKTTEEILAEAEGIDPPPDYDAPKPLSPLENFVRNDEHNAP